MKNILVVTGGAGFVGSNLVKFLLLKTNYKIISLDNYSSGSINNHIKDKRVKYIKSETFHISTKLDKFKKKIKALFHFGEFARIHQSFYNTEDCFASNISGTSNVFYFCLKNKIKIIYSATSASLGNKGKDQSLSPYAFTKSKNLQLLSHLKKWFGLSYEALYFYNVYGPGQILNGSMAAVIGIFETQFRKKKTLTVVKPGSQKRDFTHISDIVRGCYLAMTKGTQNEYMLCTNKTYSILQIVKIFNTKYKFLKSRPGDRFGSTTLNNNAKTILGFQAKIDVKEYIKTLIR